MARKKAKWEEGLELFWVPSIGHWKKNYTRYEDGEKKRKQWSIRAPHTLAGHQQALAEWRKVKAKIEGECLWAKPNGQEYKRAIEDRQEQIAMRIAYGEDAHAQELQDEITQLELAYKNNVEPPPVNTVFANQTIALVPFPHLSANPDITKAVLADRMRAFRRQREQASDEPESNSLAALITKFVAEQAGRAERGDIANGTAENYKYRLEHIRRLVGTKKVDDLNEALIAELEKQIPALGKSKAYTHGIGKDFRDFIDWLWSLRLLAEKPRNVKKLRFSVPKTANVTYTKAEIKQLLSLAKGKMRLYLLLMLNCGMTQVDIANIAPNEVDWKAGTITRKRTKTQDEPNVPTVTFTLWPEVKELLLEHGSRKGTPVEINGTVKLRVLTSEKGTLLVDRSKTKIDNIANAYGKLIKRNKITHGKTLKHFRKTGSDKINSRTEYKLYKKVYLGHAPTDEADIHYTNEHAEPLAEVTNWLGKELGIIPEE